jgi:hypothetical protein
MQINDAHKRLTSVNMCPANINLRDGVFDLNNDYILIDTMLFILTQTLAYVWNAYYHASFMSQKLVGPV